MNKRIRLTTWRWGVVITLVVALFLAISAAGCTSTPTPTISSSPEQPVLEPAGPEITVGVGESITIRASAKGANRYEWKLVGVGNIPDKTADTILYTAPPDSGKDSKEIVTVTAFNAKGEASPPASLTIRIPTGLITASVRLDALAIPAGWMSGGNASEQFISLSTAAGHLPGSKSSLITYIAGGVWGGWFWWPQSCGKSGTPDAWEKAKNDTCGINVLEAGSLGAVNRLTFWARGEKGGEIIEFKIGAVDISPKPGRSSGKVSLASAWKQYEIDLNGMDLTNAVALFAWIAADVDNPQGAVFYLDDIQFEGTKK